jgi:hypothetical protein
MRGSGTPVSAGFVASAGVEGLGAVTFSSPSGPVTIGRSASQNWIGTLRQAALDLNADLGDYLFVVLAGNGNVEFELVHSSDLLEASAAERLALEIGTRLDLWGGDILAAVSHALGFATGPEHTSLSEVSQRLQARSEGDLISLLNRSLEPPRRDLPALEERGQRRMARRRACFD